MKSLLGVEINSTSINKEAFFIETDHIFGNNNDYFVYFSYK